MYDYINKRPSIFGVFFMSYINTAYPKSEITSNIIQCAIEVHKTLGPGFNEVIYQRSLSLELRKAGIEHNREQWLDVTYKGIHVGKKRVDFVLDDIIIETKAKSQYDPQDYMQTISYLKSSGYQIALLINFGTNKVTIKRFINN